MRPAPLLASILSALTVAGCGLGRHGDDVACIDVRDDATTCPATENIDGMMGSA